MTEDKGQWAEVADEGISHLAVFVSDGDARTRWLVDLAEATDTR